jgi:2,5-diketo-D-gluconate reductase B
MSRLFQGANQRLFGTWPLKGDQARDAILSAAEVGYRAFDTAQMYGNEAEVGQALRETGLGRNELLIQTKVHPDNYSRSDFLPSVERSLEALGVDEVDILLLHWPPVGGAVEGPLDLLNQCLQRGFCREVGVSNFNLDMLRTAKDRLDAPVAVNQVEFHPLLDQSRLLSGASAMGVPLSAYCSVAKGKVFEESLLEEIGALNGKSAAQVALRWLLQKGVAPVTMSTKPANQAANFDIMNFSLSNVEMAMIDSLAIRRNYRIVDADRIAWAPKWD